MSCKWRLMDRFDLLKSPLFMLIENDLIQKAKSLRMYCSWWPPVKKYFFRWIFEKFSWFFGHFHLRNRNRSSFLLIWSLYRSIFSIFVYFPGIFKPKNVNLWNFIMIFLCSRNDFSRVKINKWQGEACFELKRVEAPLAKSSIVPSYALIPNKRFQKKTKTLFQPQFSFHKPFLKKMGS